MRLLSRLLALVALVALGACTIASTQPLVTDAEATAVLPDTFFMHPYSDRASAPDYVRAEDPAMRFDRVAGSNGYASADGNMTVRFVPLEPTLSLLAVEGPDGYLYGTARYADAILELNIVVDDGSQAVAGAAPAGLGVRAPDRSDGALEVTSREGLDFVVAAIRDGRLQMAPLVAWIAEREDATAPARIVRSGDWFVAD